MNHRYFLVFLIFFLYSDIICQTSKFKDAIKDPIHHTPNFYPETYDQKGYTKLLDTLIRWEMTRSMYDYKFSGSTDQIKILSIITESSYGMAMFYYFEGFRKGLGDPINAEYDFLKALEYFKTQKDTSAILHTTMHMLRLSLNTTMVEIGNIKRYQTLYEDVLNMGKQATEPFDQIIYYRMKIIYNEYFSSLKKVSFFKDDIDKSLSIVRQMPEKYDYYKFLMLNAIGIIHSKNIQTIESEHYHQQALDIIKKYPSLELYMAYFRLGVMQYTNLKIDEATATFDKILSPYSNKRITPNTEITGYWLRMLALIHLHNGDLVKAKAYFDLSHWFFQNDFFKTRHLLYMEDMAAIYKLEENYKTISESEKKRSRLSLILVASISLLGFLSYYIHLRRKRQKLLEQEIRKKDFIYSLIGHDLSSPIVDMDMTIDHIETDLKNKLNTDQKNYLHQLRIKTQGANLLLMNLLDLYKEKKLYLHQNRIYPSIYIKDEINSSISHLLTTKIETNVKVMNNCPEELVIRIDRQAFQCVIRNIVDNALKHSQCDTIIFGAEIYSTNLVITIQDNGIGLPADITEIFNQNKSIFDYSNSKTRIGLGTFFVLEFVNALKSELKVESNQIGTKFVLTIPCR